VKTIYEAHGSAFEYNQHVVIECLLGVPDEKRIGRLVQVRKGVGAFGSDVLIIRLRDGSCATYENALIRRADDKRFEDAFYRSNGKTPPEIPEQPCNEADTGNDEFTIAGKFPETGFIIEKPKQPESARQSFMIAVTNPK